MASHIKSGSFNFNKDIDNLIADVIKKIKLSDCWHQVPTMSGHGSETESPIQFKVPSTAFMTEYISSCKKTKDILLLFQQNLEQKPLQIANAIQH